MTTPLTRLLDRLHGAEKHGTGWRARCPCHGSERNRALSLAEAEDSRVLLYDFGGCEVTDILAAVGLTLADLFPERITHHGKPLAPRQRRRYGQALDALDALAHESLIITIAADALVLGTSLDNSDIDRLVIAADRIRQAHLIAGRPLPRRQA